MMNGISASRNMIVMGTMVILTVAACLVCTDIFGNVKFISLAAVAVALITFFGFLHLGMRTNKSGLIADSDMRTSITAAIIVSYLTIMGMAIFFGENAGKMPPISQTLLTNFTSIVGVVIAFYFGSTAYVDAQKHKKAGEEPNDIS